MRKSNDLWCCTSIKELQTKLMRIDFRQVHKRSGKKREIEYLDITCTLDIETTSPTVNDGFTYAFQFNIAGVNCQVRYIEDFLEFLDWAHEYYVLSRYKRMVFYIHNLGFEHIFMTQILRKHYGIQNILLTKKRKPLTILFGNGIEFRDSLKLFQKGLDGATKGCPHAKLKGDLDYDMYRTPDTPLSPDEWNYCINDVQGLYEAIERLKKERGYNQATIPYTNTGMVLKEVNDAVRDDFAFRKACGDLTLTKDQLRLAYNCMGGGDTHGSRWKAGRIFKNCNSHDYKSCHPAQQLLYKFPMRKSFDLPENVPEEKLKSLIASGYGWLGEVCIIDYNVLPDNPDPTISISKTSENEGLGYIDNGRVCSAKASMVYMDSNDYQRFIEGYTYKRLIGVNIMAFKLDYLPESFRKAIQDKFAVKESAEDGPDRNFAKICVNTIFGACAQKVIRDEYSIIDDDLLEAETKHWEDNLESFEESTVSKRQQQKFPFLWGLWTASLSRLALWNLIKAAGWEDVIYWDTDSVKYKGEVKPEIEEINKKVIAQCIERKAAVIGKNGKIVYIGVAENEHPDVKYGYAEFTFLHAKCYAALSWDKKSASYKIESTIAGVGKREGVKALCGDIGNLKDGLVINPAGGLALTYVDLPVYKRKFKRETECASFIHMEPRVYEVKTGVQETIDRLEMEIIA